MAYHPDLSKKSKEIAEAFQKQLDDAAALAGRLRNFIEKLDRLGEPKGHPEGSLEREYAMLRDP